MKKIVVLFALLVNLTVSAQEKITEGIVISKQTVSSDNPQLKAQLEAMKDIVATTYFKDNKSRSELSSPISGSVVTITDSKDILILMDNPRLGKKYMIKNIKNESAKAKEVNVVAGTDVKTFLGYTCKHYTVTLELPAGKMVTDMYTTTAISLMSQQTAMLADKIEGFPLYITMEMDQMGSKMTTTTEVTEVKKEMVSDDKLKMVTPEGYEKM